ncbi:hypothetical protein [Dysgonomonas capnocytophagoides]|uniref:hypothetical protein n=1 Tax=Dysgonomonas capnocytophagoides TaxID=45254 RepID=UPI00141B1601|nr:hypothetical protein [Dysgonomonas capnocytophagoides]
MNTDAINTLLIVIPVISAILGIVLFFKVWKMCDNVNELTNIARKKMQEEKNKKESY